ncbi:MAG: hypothetical protein AAGF04_04375 [Chlamydiota bacterium]
MELFEDKTLTRSVLLLLVFLLWGGWAHTFKCTRGSRFEIYCIDFVVGILLATGALFLLESVASFHTVGELVKAWRETRVLVIRAFFAGIVFNIANIFLIASSAFSGIGTTFLTVFGTALIVDQGIYSYFSSEHHAAIWIGSSFFLLLSIFPICLLQKRLHFSEAKKAMGLSCVAGICLSLFYPLFDRAIDTVATQRLPAIIACIFLAAGITFSGLFCAPILCRKPLFGHAIGFSSYARAPFRYHKMGALGGALWFSGLWIKLHAERSPHELGVFFAVQLAPLCTFFLGIFVWREIASSWQYRKLFLSLFFCYLLGVFLIAYDRYGS